MAVGFIRGRSPRRYAEINSGLRGPLRQARASPVSSSFFARRKTLFLLLFGLAGTEKSDGEGAKVLDSRFE
jgi:hypothetical protein